MAVRDTAWRTGTDRLSPEMSRWRSPDVGSWRGRAAIGLSATWGMLGLLVVAALGYWTWRVVEHTSYH
ncbi:MAG: hypothetical protein ACRDUT_16020, partial [Mycobacterium sp.]